MPIAKSKPICFCCGREITQTIKTQSYSPRNKSYGIIPYCSFCLQSIFDDMLNKHGSHKVAVFYFCVFLDLPCERKIIEKLTANGTFFNQFKTKMQSYCSGIGECGFANGDCQTLEQLLTVKETKKHKIDVLECDDKDNSIDEDRDRGEIASVRMCNKWGIENLSRKDAKELERLYDVHTADRKFDLDSTGTEAIIAVCKLYLDAEKYRQKGDTKKMNECLTAADNRLKSEKLRKSDESPVELDDFSGMVVEIERFFSSIPQLPDLIYFLFDTFPSMFPHPITPDAADHILMDLKNHQRRDDGLEDLTELPNESKIVDYLGEFLPRGQEQPWQKKVMDLIGIYPDLDNVNDKLLLDENGE